jgi:23S rRNA (cytosine1962-C5)-methyltransferase
MYPTLKLKAGKEANVIFRHPWIFSGALAEIPDDIAHGSLVHVVDSGEVIIATGTYSAKSMIAVRVFEFGRAVIDKDWFRARFTEADALRTILGYGSSGLTSGYRLVFGESDRIPGLIVDRYENVLVIQLATAGLEQLREMIIEVLVDLFRPRSIVERSDISVRREEGLEEITALRYGSDPGRVEFRENGLRFVADVNFGQKTGFYLDQKELRKEIREHARGRAILNLFSYTGAASAAALAGGAKSVLNIDSSEPSLELCNVHAEMNGIPPGLSATESGDVFGWLSTRYNPEYDMVLMDPPALIKSQVDIDVGRKAYHFLNRAAMRLIKDCGLLVTSSCSAFFREEDFTYSLRRASVQAGVRLDLLKMVRQSPDHPISLYFPESYYLKSFICRVRR